MSNTALVVILTLAAFWGGIFTETNTFGWQFWICAIIVNIAGYHLTKEQNK